MREINRMVFITVFHEQIPLLCECDIVGILLWARIGTRLPEQGNRMRKLCKYSVFSVIVSKKDAISCHQL
ncbi:hypothetical protein Pan54_04390 [Rubinisphaera italica]|uniref:Uncharacterized protein n=1 Tax=Rubinisphaera italica TaxID=2527969 RepID=A0A5C5XAJ7_9PLAN|nr:hypothetical protein Pan54_04390 [Rubinisphaera italica]